MSASSEREASLKSARQKVRTTTRLSDPADSHQLASYRARQNRASTASTSSAASSSTRPSIEAKRVSHAHKRSRSGASVVMPARNRHSRGPSLAAIASPPVDIVVQPEQTPPRRGSVRRHSRTESILSANDVLSATPSAATMASSQLSGWSFPVSPQQSSTAAFAAQQAQRRANRQSLPFPTPSAPLSSSAGRPLSLSASPRSPLSSSTTALESTHARKLSRHARRASLTSRRESMEIMSGVPLALPESISPAHSLNASPIPPAQHFLRERSDALDALEGRTPPAAQIDSFDFPALSSSGPSSSVLSVPDKRASWQLNSSMTATGGKGALDLGMLVEEEEEEEGNVSAVSTNATPQPQRVGRQRPMSLFMPSSSVGSPLSSSASTPALSQAARRPLDQSVSSIASVQTPTSETSKLGRRSLALNTSVHPGAAESTVIPIGGRRRASSIATNKRNSRTSPSNGTFGDLVMGPSSPEPVRHSSAVISRTQTAHLQATIERLHAELSTAEARVIELDSDLRLERQGAGDHAARLHDAEGALLAARAEMDAERAERAVEVEKIRAELTDAIAERDDLRDDVSGWRQRCADSDKKVEQLSQALEHERREGALARDKARKLSDRLAAANSVAPDAALASAQARLIGEMREQVISLATALDREKQAHAATQAALSAATSDQPTTQLKPVAGRTASIVRSDSDASSVASMASFGARSYSNGNAVDMSDEGFSFATTVATSSPPSRQGSFSEKSVPINALGVSVAGNALSLDTLTEVSEEEYEATESTAVPSMLPGSHSPTRGSGSTCSISSEPMPRTPIHESMEAQLDVASEDEGHHPSHNRSDSFIKQWAFPRGTVPPLKYALHDDHSFWSIAGAQTLPPLPIDEQKHIIPPFFNAEITLDAEYYSKRMSAPTLVEPPATSPGPRPLQLARAVSTPLPAMRSVSPASRMAPPPVSSNVSSSPSRMSLGGLGSFVRSYISPAASPLAQNAALPSIADAPMMVKASSGSSTTSSVRSAASSKRSTPVLVPSPLSVLDFTRSAGRDGRILNI